MFKLHPVHHLDNLVLRQPLDHLVTVLWLPKCANCQLGKSLRILMLMLKLVLLLMQTLILIFALLLMLMVMLSKSRKLKSAKPEAGPH